MVAVEALDWHPRQLLAFSHGLTSEFTGWGSPQGALDPE
ncbi:MAG: hypothetical protein ACJA04_001117 [Cellvibrionaceae bacterium]|jgi:hypothetical protein